MPRVFPALLAFVFLVICSCNHASAQSLREFFLPENAIPTVDYSKVPKEIVKNDLHQATQAPTDNDQLRIAFLGNTLIHRDAEFGFLEAELTRRAPHKNIVFRNLGWPGDTVSGSARLEFGPGEEKSGNWQRPDQDTTGYGLEKIVRHLSREAPHVVFVAYGSNVAFAGEQGMDEFRTGLDELLNALKPTGTQVVLISPPPRDTGFHVVGNLAEQNVWLAKVAKHLGDVADRKGLEFVDLFSKWPKDAKSFADNGIHLNEHGYRLLASLVADQVSPDEGSWQVHLSNDQVTNQVGATATDIQSTQYGLRWKVTDGAIPQANGVAGNERILKIDGLESGTYSLDVDGRRSARGTAAEFAKGLNIQAGPDFQRAKSLRQAIIEKNRQYFYRYRPQNRAYIHLFRKYERGHHAAELERFALLVREHEQEIARIKTPVERIYELVKEKDYPENEVPGENSEPDPEKELAKLNIPDGFEINLFASDPLISKPININFDERGRLWVSTSNIYPHLQPGQTPTDRILILEDIDHDGRADKSTVFADDLLVPQSVLPGDGGVYVTQSTDLLFLKDTDGDNVADEKRVLLTGFGNADVHHMIHQLRWGPDGDIYFQQSIYINSSIETPWGVETCNGSCVWRLRPETLKLEKHSIGLVNPWGHAFDDWGQSFATDGAGGGGLTYIFPGASHKTNTYADRELPNLNPGRPKECGLEFLSGRHLPADWQGTFMSNDFRANRSTRYRTHEDGSGYVSDFLGDMVTSGHRGFRPVDIKMGPDGAIYIVDWYNLIIDHGEVDFHHPLRDKQHGRIWRMTKKDSPLVEKPNLANASVGELLDMLLLPEQFTRGQAKRLLREKGAEAVTPALKTWAAAPSRNDHDRLEALWLYQGLRQPNEGLLEKCLTAGDHRARAAAVRVLGDWSEQVDDSMAMFRRAIEDTHPQVRLEAVNALRRVGSLAAVNLAMHAVDETTDASLEFALFRTAHELRDVWLPDFRAGRSMFEGNAQRIAFALGAVGGETSVEPLADLVRKQKVQDDQLVDALAVLASFGNVEQRTLVVDHVKDLPPKSIPKVLAALAQSSSDESPTNASDVVDLIASSDSQTRSLAIRLAGRWKVKSAVGSVRQIVTNKDATAQERLAAGKAIVAIDAQDAARFLKGAFPTAPNENVAATTLAAWSGADQAEAMPLAVSFFGKAQDLESATVLADALVSQRAAPKALAAELTDVDLRTEVAQMLLERVRLSGQENAELVSAIRKSGKLKALADLTSGEISSILNDVAHGSSDRGKEVFLRKETQCAACHRIAGQGGRVGPDLSSVGTTERLGNILKSILQPSENIKQGYNAVHVFLEDGRVVSGVLQQQTETHVKVRDAKDQEHTIPMSEVDEIEQAKLSIMPVGLTEQLSRQELVDLLKYLSSLGQTP